MPELPEVHIIVEDLKKYAKHANVDDVVIHDSYNVEPENEHLIENTKDTKITNVERVAKNIVLHLSNGSFIQIHLAMTGRLLLRPEQKDGDNWRRVTFHLTKNNKKFELRFCDMRMFGKVAHLNTLDTLKAKYGPEPIDEKLTPEVFLKHIKSKNTNIKNVLLDQNIIAGLGNVYATDALWMAKIHPESRTKNISIENATELLKSCREILNEGISNRGISMKDYVDLFGKKGKQQNYFRIYGKSKCPRCNNNVEFKKINGRGTYFCTNCQFIPSEYGVKNLEL